MFALEIDFRDGVSPPEVLLLRRTHAIIGSSDFAQVVVEGAASSYCDLRLSRGVGGEFRCQPLIKRGKTGTMPPFLEGMYSREADLSLGEVTVHVTALDIDLGLLPDEAPDRAAVRILRRALSSASPVFPALGVKGTIPVFVSFAPDQPLFVGRSRKCGLRLESADVSSEHARVGFEDGEFWVEDLGSTNGTFVSGERISGRRVLERDEEITVGAEFKLVGVRDLEELTVLNVALGEEEIITPVRVSYPAVISDLPSVKPTRVPLPVGSKVAMGRDPANGIWVGAAHVSRTHAELESKSDGIWIVDVSSNGTYVNGERLPRGTPVLLPRGHTVIDLNNGITLSLCFSEEEERALREGNGLLAGPAQPLFSAGHGSAQHLQSPSFEATGQMPALEAGGGISALLSAANEAESDPGNGRGAGVFERLAQRKGNRAGSGTIRPSFLEPISEEELVGADKTFPSMDSLVQDFEVAPDEEEGAAYPRMGNVSRTVLLTAIFALIFLAVALTLSFVS